MCLLLILPISLFTIHFDFHVLIHYVFTKKMATPLSSLNKRKKLPLGRNVAFRMSSTNAEEQDSTFPPDVLALSSPALSSSHSLESLSLDMDPQTQASIVRDARRAASKKLRSPTGSKLAKMHSLPSLSAGGAGSTDLLTSMSKKLRLAERQLVAANRELASKRELVRELEARVSFYDAAYDRATRPGKLSELESRNSALQRQIADMEEFLSDYGLIWVGKEEDELPRTGTGLGEATDRVTTSLTMLRSNLSTQLSGSVWVPESATPASMGSNIDFNLILRNVKALNLLLGERAEVVRTDGGARFRRPDTLPLTLYKNGFMLFQGPFRAYTDPSAFQVVQDIQDGCFPQELSSRYPGGLPFDVFDRREVEYEDPRLKQRFPGVGRTLGGKEVVSSPRPLAELYEGALSPLNGASKKRSSDRPQGPVPIERFLNKLPASIVMKGKLIDIRSEIEARLNPSPAPLKVTCIPSQQIETAQDSSNLVHLKVRSEDGSEVYALRLPRTSSISHLLSLLRDSSRENRELSVLKTNFPVPRVLSDTSKSLDAYQLFPSALLFLSSP